MNSPHPAVCAQQRGIPPRAEPPQGHTVAFCHTLSLLSLPWGLGLCARGMDSLQAPCPTSVTNIHWTGH